MSHDCHFCHTRIHLLDGFHVRNMICEYAKALLELFVFYKIIVATF
jgi:hypothetical protein